LFLNNFLVLKLFCVLPLAKYGDITINNKKQNIGIKISVAHRPLPADAAEHVYKAREL
jgi:hypothetical protein